MKEIESFTANSNIPVNKIVVDDNNAVSSASWNGAQVSGSVGATFGSSIGTYIGQLVGGNNLAIKIGAGTLGGAIGKEIGNALQYGASFSLDTVVTEGLANVPGGFAGGLPGAAIGALSSLLVGEIADALHLPGFASGLFQTAGTSVTTQLLTNAFGIATASINPGTGLGYTLFDGFNTVEFASGLSGAIGGYLGGALHAQIALPHYPEGATGQHLGASIGSAIGTVVGTFAGGPIGAFVFAAIGSFVGSGFGTFIGDAFAPEAEAHGDLQFDPATHHFIVDSLTYGQVRSKSASGYYMVAQYQADFINKLADLAGAQLDGVRTINTPFGSYSVFEKLHFKQQGMTYYLSEETLNPFITIATLDPREALNAMADAGIMEIVHNTHISGGDPLVRLAWDHSKAETGAAFALDLQAAKDYRAYLDDKPMIDALMAAEPESVFTLGWLMTLLKARELGLDSAGANDDFRAGNDTLNGSAAGELLVGGAGHDIIDGGAGNDRIRGDAGNDIIRGGAGNDIIIGGADFDTARFSGSRWSYTLNDLGNGVIGVTGPDGADQLVQIERLQFDDMALDLPLRRDLWVGWSFAKGSANFDIWNTGNIATPASAAGIYLSSDPTLTTSDILVSTVAISAINPGSFDRKSIPVAFPGNLTPGTYYLGVIADKDQQVTESDELNNASTVIAVMLGSAAANSIAGSAGADTIYALGGNDWINGGAGADIITGGTGADRFVVDATAWYDAAASGIIDRVTDYNRSGGAFNGAEGDQVDLSPILSSAFGVLPANEVVRAVASGSGVKIQIDRDGAANGVNWTTVMRLDDVPYGQAWINVFLHPAQPLGTTIPILPAPSQDSFNGDSKGDILWQNANGAPGVWLMNGTTVMQMGGALHNPGPSWHARTAADFNGDGKADILWQNDSGETAVWLLDGVNLYSMGGGHGNPDPSWHVRGAADFNGDGKADILWQNDAGVSGVWLMNGTTVAQMGGGLWNPGPSWHDKAAGDFDGDGKADIVMQNDDGTPSIWLMDGTNVASYGGGLTNPGPDWHVRDAADFNGDGKADLLWESDGGLVGVWLMDGTNVMSMGGALPFAGAGWHLKGASDFDGDGQADILWQHSDGTPAVWLMHGTSVYSTGAPLPNPGPDWHAF